MNPLPSVAAVYEQMDQARRAGPLVTNFYPVPDKLQRSIERRELFSMTAGSVLFVLRRDRDFLHVSYVASAAAALVSGLRDLTASVHDTLVVDVLGPRERVAEIGELFAQAGFHAHAALDRMTMVRKPEPPETAAPAASAPPAPADGEVVFARADDGPALAAMLEASHDRYAEQIPDAEDMARAAAAHQVLVIRSGAAIAGLLFFEVTGQSSHLRYWLVDPAFREQRIGARLMRRYHADCKDVRRFLLWVISDNHNAIDRYRHYGYQRDGLIDQVLIRQPS